MNADIRRAMCGDYSPYLRTGQAPNPAAPAWYRIHLAERSARIRGEPLDLRAAQWVRATRASQVEQHDISPLAVHLRLGPGEERGRLRRRNARASFEMEQRAE